MEREDYHNQGIDNGRAATMASGQVGAVSTTDKNYASKTFANIQRAEYADYQRLYQPLHGEFLDMATSPDFALEQVDRVADNVNSSFDRAASSRASTLERMGVQDREQDDSIARSLALVQGENATRQAGKERQMSTLAGTLGQLTAE